MNYLAVEGHPLTPDELEQSLAPWRELFHEAAALLQAYSTPSPGFHRLHLADGITLTLLCGDAAAMRLTLVSVALSVLALLASEAFGRVVRRRVAVA